MTSTMAEPTQMSQSDAEYRRKMRRWRNRAITVAVLGLIVLYVWSRMTSAVSFWTQVLNGLSFGSTLFFLASGFTLIFGLMQISNLAHGGFYMVGGYIGVMFIGFTGNFFIGILTGALGVMLVGLFTERVLLRPIRGLEKQEVLLTIGLTFILGDGSLAIWGGDPLPTPRPDWLKGPLQIGDFIYPRYNFFVITLAVIIGGILFYIDRRTKVGAMVRAGVDDRETVAALGINIKAVFTGVFMFGAFLAGMSGVIGAGTLALQPGQEFEFLLFGLVVVIIGGLGSLEGAALGAVVVGLIDAFAKQLFPELSFFTLFAPMAIILVVKPAGLLGRV
jgi:branched-chain amino acid transport system permease protein